MLTVTRLARMCGLSRGTVLHYEALGLLRPVRRAGSGRYRVYGPEDVRRLQQIRRYREAGLTLGDIGELMADRTQPGGAEDVLERRLSEISLEIEKLRGHQRALARLLRESSQALRSFPMVSKEKWVEIMKAAGFSDDDMYRWHAEFEKAAPDEHQEFLEFLKIPADEVTQIRAWSRSLGAS